MANQTARTAFPIPQSSEKYWEIKNQTNTSAELYLYSTISSWGEEWGDTSAKDVINAVKNLGNISQLKIYINSPGGTVSEGMAIKAFLARQTFKKDVYIDGLCASIATAIAFGINATVHMESTALVMICASQMSFSLDVSVYGGSLPGVSSSAECKIGNFTAPTYYVTGRQLDGSVYTITGTDRTIFLDMPFNYTSCSWEAEHSKDNTVATASVVQSIASQAGFKGCNYGNIPEIIPRLHYADLATSCRSILTSLSEIACGMWYCGQGDSLQFFGYGDQSAVYTSFPNESADLQKGISVGPMAGVVMINDSTDSGDSEQFTSGYVEDSFRAIKIVSKYATASACSMLLKRIEDVEYTAFTLPHCYCYTFYPIGTQVVMNEYDLEVYLATNIVIYLSPTGSYASFSGDASSEFEWDFSGHLTQQVKDRIAENTKYHGVSISKKEGLVCEGVGCKVTMSDGKITFHTQKHEATPTAIMYGDGTKRYVREGEKLDTSDDSTEDESDVNCISAISIDNETSTESNAVKLVSVRSSTTNSEEVSSGKANENGNSDDALINVVTEPGKKVTLFSFYGSTNSDATDETATDNNGGDKNGN